MFAAPTLHTGLSPLQLWQIVVVVTLLAAQWVKEVVFPARPGTPRLLRALPVLLLCQVSGFLFRNDNDEMLLRTTCVFMFSWLAAFKVLALCLDRGPLRPGQTFGQVACLLLLPIYAQEEGAAGGEVRRGRLADRAPAPLILMLMALINASVLMFVVYASRMDLPIVLRHYLLAFGLYSFVSLIMNGPASILTHLVRLSVIPPFDKPFLSSSIGEFWGRRWNITTSSVLRVLVHDVIAEGRFIKAGTRSEGVPPSRPPSYARRALGVLAAFLVSGLIHEYILWMIQPDGFVSGKWLVFFGMQGPLLLLEAIVVRQWRQHHLPPLNVWLARVITLGVLEVCAYWFFFPPTENDTLTSQRVIGALENAAADLAAHVGPAVSLVRARVFG